jgi:hypothetical protein
MEALYFGNAHWRGNTGLGSGPWVGADLEQGMCACLTPVIAAKIHSPAPSLTPARTSNQQ